MSEIDPNDKIDVTDENEKQYIETIGERKTNPLFYWKSSTKETEDIDLDEILKGNIIRPKEEVK